MKKNVFGTCDGWSNGYSSLMIIGATREQVIKKAKELSDWNDVFYNYSDLVDTKCICIDAYRQVPDDMCDLFGSIGENVVVYGSWHWDEDSFAFRKNKADYNNFTASFENNTPRESDEEGCFDVDVLIIDTDTGCEMCVGGGMCTEDEKIFYEELVKSHGESAVTIKTIDDVVLAIKELTKSERKTIEQMCIKLMEESGETAQAILSSENAPGSEYKTLTAEDAIEECVDVIIVATSLIFKLGGSMEDLQSEFSKKIDKWKKNQ